MSLSNEGSSLALFDAHEQIRILAAVMGDEPTMTLYHFNGEPGAFSSLHSTGDSTMVLADPAGKGRLWVKTNMLTTSLGLYDRQGKTRVNLNADHYGTELALGDMDGNARAELRVNEQGAHVTLLDANGTTRGSFFESGDASSLIFYDAKAKRAHKLP